MNGETVHVHGMEDSVKMVNSLQIDLGIQYNSKKKLTWPFFFLNRGLHDSSKLYMEMQETQNSQNNFEK